MLEYGEAYLEANERIIEAMAKRMSPGAVALAERMAAEAMQDDENELSDVAASDAGRSTA